MADLYSQADLFVFPTLADEWGLVVDEAMWMGVPVLGSVFAQSVTDLVRDGQTGWRYDPLITGDLERALRVVVDCPDQQIAMMRSNTRKAVERRTPAYAADLFVQAASAALHRLQVAN